ncbi:hypothetical protein HDU99_007134, partial [Rhizoclosmatium hyalinum]
MTGHGSTTTNATANAIAPKDIHGHGTPAVPATPSAPSAADVKPEPKVPKEEKSSSFAIQELTAFYSAVMFFTRLSVPRWVNHSMYWLSLGTMYFPLIGVIVGAFGVFWFSLAYHLFPGSTIIPAVIYSMATIRFTGAFHEDGLADMCDGFGGGWKRESILRIMRDSANGTFAGLGLILFQLTKLGGVAYLIDTIELVPVVSTTLTHPNAPHLLAHVYKLAHLSGILISAHVLARWSCTYLLWRYKYVENASAAGKEFLLTVTTTRMIMATISTIVLVAAALFA